MIGAEQFICQWDRIKRAEDFGLVVNKQRVWLSSERKEIKFMLEHVILPLFFPLWTQLTSSALEKSDNY